jgi:putative membrane protein
MSTTSSQDATSTGITSPVFVVQQPIGASSLNDQDRQFIAQANAGNLTEITAGRLALSNSDNTAVQVFGQWMATDHIAVSTLLNDIAKQLGVTTETSLTPEQTQEIQSLRSQSGAEFDQLYAQGQVADHQQTLALFQQEIANGQNATLKAIAQQAIPVLEQHFAGAQQLSAGIGSGNTDPGSSSGSGSGDPVPPQTTTPQQTSATDTTQTSATDTTQTSATDTTQTPAGTPSAQDTSFVQFAAQAGLAEVQEGQLAISNNTDLAVSEYGRWMVTDHTANNAVLQNVATQAGIAVPTAPSAEQQAEIAELQSLPPEAFASAYSREQVSDHANTLLQFIKEAETGQNPALKAFAQDTIPVLAQHLGAAINLELDQLGINALGPFSVSDLTQLLYGTAGVPSGQTGGESTASNGSASQMLSGMGLQDSSQMAMAIHEGG